MDGLSLMCLSEGQEENNLEGALMEPLSSLLPEIVRIYNHLLTDTQESYLLQLELSMLSNRVNTLHSIGH